MTSPLAAWTTPTWNRPDTHASLYGMFKSQTYKPLRLYVFDESTEPSPFFSQLQDPDVTYVHEPMAYKRDVTRIGAARNKLCAMARADGAEFVCSADDDDVYAPNWTTTMISKLGDADVAKLAVFRLLVTKGEAAGTLWLWDVRAMGGVHYGLKGAETPQKAEIEPGDDPMYETAVRYGFAFSWIWRSELSERIKFPEEGTEDYPWLRECMKQGAKVVEVDDYSEGCIHCVGSSNSMHFPQTPLSPGFAGSPLDFRAFVRARMLGALPAMYEITKAGKSFTAEPGVTYSIVAKIKKSHTLKSVTTRAESWGLVISAARDDVDGSEFGVTCDDKDFRLVHVVGTSKERMEIPWQGNKLVRALDKSSIERAWSDVPSQDDAQVNAQLTPSAGVAGFLGRVRRARAGVGSYQPPKYLGFGGGRCETCVNFAWEPAMGPSQKAIDGTMHHAACPKLAGLADTKMERRIQRMQARLRP